MKNQPEIYVSIDIEADGPIPGPHSMLSLGAVALDAEGTELGSWYANFDLLEGAQAHPDTQKFWAEHQKYYDLTRTWCQTPTEAMTHFVEWVEALPGRPVAVAAPAGFDFTWVYWYMMRFVGRSAFSFSCVDMRTVSMCVLNRPYTETTKRRWPRHWFHPTVKHSHHAEEDAREQGYSFVAMLRDLRQQHSVRDINN
jgi:hypothetical protein